MYPVVSVGESHRVPDIRARSTEATWLYIEVTQPEVSKAGQRVRSAVLAVADLAETIRQPYTLEVFFRREPTGEEIKRIETHVAEFCASRVASGERPLEGLPPDPLLLFRPGEPDCVVEFARQELPEDLGPLVLTQGKPGEIVVRQHPGEQYRPRFSEAKRVRVVSEPDPSLCACRFPTSGPRNLCMPRQTAPQGCPGIGSM